MTQEARSAATVELEVASVEPWMKYEVVIDGERYYAESKLVAALACVYPNSGTLVAHLCDEHLSRSGRLLGIVRDVAMEARRVAS